MAVSRLCDWAMTQNLDKLEAMRDATHLLETRHKQRGIEERRNREKVNEK